MPACEDSKYMSDDTFAMILIKANSIRRETESLLGKFQLLGACHSFKTMPEGSLELAVARLREAADFLEEMVEETESVRRDTYHLEAAE
jgi:hypothetical protein